MAYTLKLSHQALADIKFFKMSGNKVLLSKILTLLEEITEHPFTGTGKPEPLRHNLTGLWSRRINREHRIVYQVLETVIDIHSLKGHY